MRDEPQFLSFLRAATTHRLAAVACTCSSHHAACSNLTHLLRLRCFAGGFWLGSARPGTAVTAVPVV